MLLACFHSSVDTAFELTVDPQCALIRKRQHLGHKNGRDTSFRIDPIIGVEKTAPGQAAGTAAVWNGLHVDHVTEAPFEAAAGKEIDVVGRRRDCRFQDAGFDGADLILSHESYGV